MLPFAGKALTEGGAAARVLKGAATGAGFGLAGGMNEGQDNSGILLSTILGAGVGGAIPAVGAAARGSTST